MTFAAPAVTADTAASDGATLDLGGTLPRGPGATLVLIANDGADPVVGTFAGHPSNSRVSVNGVTGRLRYDGGDGNDVVFRTTTTGQDTAREVAVSGGQAVTVLSPGGATGQTVFSVFPFEASFTGGTFVAAGDVDGDGLADLVVAAGTGGGPRVAVFDGASLRPGQAPARAAPDFFAYEPSLRDGMFVTVGDVTGDGRGDLIVGGGPTGGARVLVLDAVPLLAGAGPVAVAVADFLAGPPELRTGARVAAKDLDGDQRADLIVAVVTGGGAAVRGYAGKDLVPGRRRPWRSTSAGSTTRSACSWGSAVACVTAGRGEPC